MQSAGSLCVCVLWGPKSDTRRMYLSNSRFRAFAETSQQAPSTKHNMFRMAILCAKLGAHSKSKSKSPSELSHLLVPPKLTQPTEEQSLSLSGRLSLSPQFEPRASATIHPSVRTDGRTDTNRLERLDCVEPQTKRVYQASDIGKRHNWPEPSRSHSF